MRTAILAARERGINLIITTPHLPSNEGSFWPLEVIIPTR